MSVAEEIMERRALQVRQAWGSILSQPDGRLVVWSILECCHLFGQTHFGNDLDGFRAGQRDVGLRLLNERIFPNDPATFSVMQREHAELIDLIELEAAKAAEEAEKGNSDE